jgi:hypothetical protein
MATRASRQDGFFWGLSNEWGDQMARTDTPIRTNVEAEFINGPRHRALADFMGWDRWRAGWTMVEIWNASQSVGKTHATAEEICLWAGVLENEERFMSALIKARLAKAGTFDGTYELVGNAKQIGEIAKYRTSKSSAGASGGRARASLGQRGPGGRFLPKQAPQQPGASGSSDDQHAGSSETPAAPATTSTLAPATTSTPGTTRPDSVTGTDTGKNNSRAAGSPLDQDELTQAIAEWGKTLKHHGVHDDPRSDEATIARALKEFGLERTLNGLAGFRAWAAAENFNPASHLEVDRFWRVKDRKKGIDRLARAGRPIREGTAPKPTSKVASGNLQRADDLTALPSLGGSHG